MNLTPYSSIVRPLEGRKLILTQGLLAFFHLWAYLSLPTYLPAQYSWPVRDRDTHRAVPIKHLVSGTSSSITSPWVAQELLPQTSSSRGLITDRRKGVASGTLKCPLSCPHWLPGDSQHFAQLLGVTTWRPGLGQEALFHPEAAGYSPVWPSVMFYKALMRPQILRATLEVPHWKCSL